MKDDTTRGVWFPLYQEFVERWAADSPPDLGNFISRVSPEERFDLFRQLVMLDVCERQKRGLEAGKAYYSARFPEFQPLIQNVFDRIVEELGETRGSGSTSRDTHTNFSLDQTASHGDPHTQHLWEALQDCQAHPNEVIGLQAGEYQFLELIAQGGMGTVYRARHRTLDRLAAIKLMRPEASTDRFIREAKLLARIRSPHVVSVYDFSVLPKGSPLIVMEWIDGVDLKRIIKESPEPIPEEKIVQWMQQVCEGMNAAAKLGVTHRDVKPSNILIDRDGYALVADFGLARSGISSTDFSISGNMMGTPLYMAPEQAEDPRNVDVRSDIYAFGGTFYHAVTGQPPFVGETAFSILFKHKMEPIVPPKTHNPNISDRVNDIIERCLAKSPRDRFQSFDEILSQLRDPTDSVSPWQFSDSKILQSFRAMFEDQKNDYIHQPEKFLRPDPYYLPNGRRLEIVCGDVTKQHVDAIVSSTDCRLSLDLGLAKAVSDAGGPLIEFDVRRLVINRVPPGRVVVTPGSELPALYVFHSITRSEVTGVTPSRDLISEIVSNCMYHATTLGIESIAFPLIGTGISRFTAEVCLDTLFRNLVRRLLYEPTSLKVARIVIRPTKDKEQIV